MKPELPAHSVKHLKHSRLVSDETLVEVLTKVQVHARLPVIKSPSRRDHTFHKLLGRVDAQIENNVRNQGHSVYRSNPCRINSTYLSASQCGVEITVC